MTLDTVAFAAAFLEELARARRIEAEPDGRGGLHYEGRLRAELVRRTVERALAKVAQQGERR